MFFISFIFLTAISKFMNVNYSKIIRFNAERIIITNMYHHDHLTDEEKKRKAKPTTHTSSSNKKRERCTIDDDPFIMHNSKTELGR